MAQNNWQPNEKQKDFMKVLGENPNGLTLAVASEKVGYEIKSGSINTLISKGLVSTEDTVLNCVVVLENDMTKVVGHCKKSVKTYHLVQKD